VFKEAMVPMVLPAGTRHVRVTRNVFALVNDQVKGERPDVEVSGDDCEVDHNVFRDKSTEGPMVTVQGPGKDGMAQRTWIHHNLFSNFLPTENNCSAIQIGLSWRSMSSAYSLVEHNLFVKCRGENEGAVCNKSCDNVYRYNTFAEGTRELSLRHGNRNQVYANYFLNTDGVRFFGHDDWIYSNYFSGCSPAIHIGNGDATIPPGKLQMHDEPVGAEVVFNTLVDNKINFYMAARKDGYGARDITIANNVVVGGGKAADIRGPLKESVWSGNVVWGTEVGDMPAGGFVVGDPKLEKVEGIWRVGAGSAVRRVSGYPVVRVDVAGRVRGERKNVGAEEGTGGGANGVLTEKDVGPGAE
jgi:poly(beta-D-mannuronate) lyase